MAGEGTGQLGNGEPVRVFVACRVSFSPWGGVSVADAAL